MDLFGLGSFSPRQQIVLILRRLVDFGTTSYDRKTARRLRFVNVIALFLITYLFVGNFAAALVLLMAGSSPFSFTVVSSIFLIAILLPTGLIHKRSPNAGAIFISIVLATAVTANIMVMGKLQGFVFAYPSLIAISICMIGRDRWPVSLGVFLVIYLLLLITDHYAPDIGRGMADRSQDTITIIRYVTTGFLMLILYLIVYYAFWFAENAEDALEAEYDRSETLLRNILPDPIALRLKEKPGDVIADRHDQVTVLFADIVDFTPRATKNPPEQVVDLLNRVFSKFDDLAEKYGLEKIKTVGDAYMVVAGIPEQHKDGPAAMADFALELIGETNKLSDELGEKVEIRVGIHTGEAVAGVIGTSKFAYDIWGDTVNTAARMEAFGVAGRIQVTEAVKDVLEDRYSFEERGFVDIKGKGKMELYFLLERQG